MVHIVLCTTWREQKKSSEATIFSAVIWLWLYSNQSQMCHKNQKKESLIVHIGVFVVFNKVLFQKLTGDVSKKAPFFCRFFRFFAFAFKTLIFLCWPNFCVFFLLVVVIVSQIKLLCSGFCFLLYWVSLVFFCGMWCFFFGLCLASLVFFWRVKGSIEVAQSPPPQKKTWQSSCCFCCCFLLFCCCGCCCFIFGPFFVGCSCCCSCCYCCFCCSHVLLLLLLSFLLLLFWLLFLLLSLFLLLFLLLLFPQNTQRKKKKTLKNPCFPSVFFAFSLLLSPSFSFFLFSLSFLCFFPLFPSFSFIPSFLSSLSLSLHLSSFLPFFLPLFLLFFLLFFLSFSPFLFPVFFVVLVSSLFSYIFSFFVLFFFLVSLLFSCLSFFACLFLRFCFPCLLEQR